jgi:hypothetical protein
MFVHIHIVASNYSTIQQLVPVDDDLCVWRFPKWIGCCAESSIIEFPNYKMYALILIYLHFNKIYNSIIQSFLQMENTFLLWLNPEPSP